MNQIDSNPVWLWGEFKTEQRDPCICHLWREQISKNQVEMSGRERKWGEKFIDSVNFLLNSGYWLLGLLGHS